MHSRLLGQSGQLVFNANVVVITAISQVDHSVTKESFKFGDEVHPTLLKLYNGIVDIQKGKAKDEYGWMYPAEGIPLDFVQ